MSNILGTSFATGGFRWDPNLSPNNQSFSAAVRAVDAAGGFVLAPPGPTINGSVITLNGTVTVTGTLNARGNIILGTATAFGWGGTWGGNNPNLPVIQIGNGGIQPRSIDGLQILSGIYHNGTNFIYTGTGTDNSGTSTGILANVTAGAFQIRSDLGTGGTNGAVASMNAVFQVTAAGNVTVFGPSSGTAVTITSTNTQALVINSVSTGAAISAAVIIRNTGTNSGLYGLTIIGGTGQNSNNYAVLSLAAGTATLGLTDFEIYQQGDGQTILFNGAREQMNFYTSGVRMMILGGTTTAPTLRAYGPTAAGLVDMTPDTGSFNGTCTGFSNPPVYACKWARNGNIVVLLIGIGTGTSNSATFNMGQLPAAITPVNNQRGAMPTGFFMNNGTQIQSTSGGAGVSVTAVNNSSLQFEINGGLNWANTGQKGILSNFVIFTYSLL